MAELVLEEMQMMVLVVEMELELVLGEVEMMVLVV